MKLLLKYLAIVILTLVIGWLTSFMVTGEVRMSQEYMSGTLLFMGTIASAVGMFDIDAVVKRRHDSTVEKIGDLLASDKEGDVIKGHYMANKFEDEHKIYVKGLEENLRRETSRNKIREEAEYSKEYRKHVDEMGEITANNIKRINKANGKNKQPMNLDEAYAVANQVGSDLDKMLEGYKKNEYARQLPSKKL